MARITYIHQYFKTPAESGALRSWYLASGLAAEGFEVTLITGGKTSKIEAYEGFTVRYIQNNYHHSKGVIGRILAFFSFAFKSFWLAFTLPKPDLLYVTSTPLTVIIPALLLKWLKGIPYIFEVRDLWPEAAIELGVIQHPSLKYFAFLLAKVGYMEAEAVVALSPDIKATIQNLVKDVPIEVIPNIADNEYFTIDVNSSSQSILTIGYFGTMGLANGITQVIPLLLALQSQFPSQWRFIFSGEGTEKAVFLKMVSEVGLVDSVIEWPQTNKEGIKHYLNQCHFSYVSFNRSAPVLSSGSPNKFFDSLAAGVPVILNFEGWLKELVTKNKVGFYQSATNSTELARQIITLFILNSEYKEVQNNCKMTALEFGKEKAINSLTTLLKKSGFSV